MKLLQNLVRRFTQFAEQASLFWQHISDGMAVHQLWEDFKADTQAGYKFYSKDVDWESFAAHKKSRRRLYALGALSWAMVRKLPPPRRVFLLLTVLLAVISLYRADDGGLFIVILALLLLLALELADRVTMKRDLEIARQIQRSLVPEFPPAVAGIEIAFATRPANTVSGDYYDAFLRDQPGANNRLLLVVADVAGKSIPAALLMATIQASLRSLAVSPLSLNDLVLGLNRYACANSLSGSRFTTAFLGEWDSAARTLTYVNAGHNAPIVKRSSGGIERLEAGGLPLGIMPAARFDSGQIVLGPRDLLIVFTDGVVEAENEAGDEFGEPRLLPCVAALQPSAAPAALGAILSAVDSFVGRTRQHDDITALVFLVQ